MDGSTITAASLLDQIRKVQAALKPVPALPAIIVSDFAVQDGAVRLFPASKHRSARVHKKLVRRFGGVFRKEPAVYKMGNRWVMHPAKYRELQTRL